MSEIVAKHLCFGYTSRDEVIHDASFVLEKGGFYGVIGPNGGGKSTILKLLLGLLEPRAGSLLIRGKAPSATRMAYVPQTFSSDRAFPISVLEVVAGGLIGPSSLFLSKKSLERSREALSQVGLLEKANHHFGSLSRGQAQRVLMARALVADHSILLLDEPTSSSDPGASATMLRVINELKGASTIVMVTHSIETILKEVDAILCIQGGTVKIHPHHLCEHFALGLYHEPLFTIPPGHLTGGSP